MALHPDATEDDFVKLPCCGEDCLDATRALVEQALQARGSGQRWVP